MSISSLWGRFFKSSPRPIKKPQTSQKKIRERLFFALSPDESTREQLVAVQGLFPPQLSENWVRPPNLHIGLALLGGVSAEWLEEVKEAAQMVRGDAFEFSLDHITYWPTRRLLCLTPTHVPAAQEKLAADLDKSLKRLGLEVEARAYQSFLQLAREAAYPPADIRLDQPILWKADSFALIESRPHGLDVAHRLVQAWPLSKPE